MSCAEDIDFCSSADNRSSTVAIRWSTNPTTRASSFARKNRALCELPHTRSSMCAVKKACDPHTGGSPCNPHNLRADTVGEMLAQAP